MPLLAPAAHQAAQLEGHDRALLGGTEEHEGHEQVVPDPQELEDGEGRQRRHGQRQHDPGEHLEVRGAVDAGRLEEVARQLADEVVEQEDGQRQAEGRVRQPHAQEVSG